ncbi:uncharacterized protein CMU_034690 [Cryptosporidium muris RN66]|uniref:Uncharacterized protein n=1 Tax=Cryptosporidium muris (strain RN66) TaxID=441375 RepID=B6AFU2_CRYMR|nr:uncharacterized protein CMU_034690 [Cryptosporidium muris RN66]EEA07083.1 hypothetical protein, conserved [Cryptosporidium muris RN66]|eukprot:XP_002141432.1 hypothetical protein [Cryptosporidium muris RN66]
MEITTYDDIETVKFVHGPKYKLNSQKTEILVCNELKYFVLAYEYQINIYKVDDILELESGSIYFKRDFGEYDSKIIKSWIVTSEYGSIEGLTIDATETILTVITSKVILFYDLSDLEEYGPWQILEHTHITDLKWTQKSDIIIIDSVGNSFIYHYTEKSNCFKKIQLFQRDGIKCRFIESFNSDSCNIAFIVVTSNPTGFILINKFQYEEMISHTEYLFEIPDTCYVMLKDIIESCEENFIDIDEEKNYSQFQILAIKYLDGVESCSIAFILAGGSNYIDGYVLIGSINKYCDFTINFYSINDLSFDDIFSQNFETLKDIKCTLIWVKEWYLLFVGSPIFSQVVLFSPSKKYILNFEYQNRSEDMSNEWYRLGMCEGYDLNTTDFEIGVCNVEICKCTSASIKDPKATADTQPIKNPPVVFISQTDGNIVAHYIGGNANFSSLKHDQLNTVSLISLNPISRNLLLLSKHEDITKTPSVDPSKKSDFENSPKTEDNKKDLPLLFNIEATISHFSCEKVHSLCELASSSTLETRNDNPETNISELLKLYKDSIESNLTDNNFKQVEMSFFNVMESIEDRMKLLDSKIQLLSDDYVAQLSNRECKSIFEKYDKIISNIKAKLPDNELFDTLLRKGVELNEQERQLGQLYALLMRKFTDEMYDNLNSRLIRDKFKGNELTSNQFSLFFQLNKEELDFTSLDINCTNTNKLREQILITERQSLKLVSRITQVINFSERIKERCSNSSLILPPPAMSRNSYSTNVQRGSLMICPDSVFVDDSSSEGTTDPLCDINISSTVNVNTNMSSRGNFEKSYRSPFMQIPTRTSCLSDIIKNISTSIGSKDVGSRSAKALYNVNADLYSNKRVSPSTSNISNSSRFCNLRLKPFRDNKTPNRYFTMHTLKDNTFKVPQKNIPFFPIKWTPNSAKGIEDFLSPDKPGFITSSPKFTEGSKFSFLNQMSQNSSGSIYESLECCIKACNKYLDSIEDQCIIARGSLDFLRRESLGSDLSTKCMHLNLNHDYSNLNSESYQNIMNAQLLLFQNSSKQRNIHYRQKLALLLSSQNYQKREEGIEDENLPCFGTKDISKNQNTSASFNTDNSIFGNNMFTSMSLKSTLNCSEVPTKDKLHIDHFPSNSMIYKKIETPNLFKINTLQNIKVEDFKFSAKSDSFETITPKPLENHSTISFSFNTSNEVDNTPVLTSSFTLKDIVNTEVSSNPKEIFTSQLLGIDLEQSCSPPTEKIQDKEVLGTHDQIGSKDSISIHENQDKPEHEPCTGDLGSSSSIKLTTNTINSTSPQDHLFNSNISIKSCEIPTVTKTNLAESLNSCTYSEIKLKDKSETSESNAETSLLNTLQFSEQDLLDKTTPTFILDSSTQDNKVTETSNKPVGLFTSDLEPSNNIPLTNLNFLDKDKSNLLSNTTPSISSNIFGSSISQTFSLNTSNTVPIASPKENNGLLDIIGGIPKTECSENSMVLGGRFGGFGTMFNTGLAPSISGFGSSQFLSGPFSNNNSSSPSSNETSQSLLSSLGPSHQSYSFGLSSSNLNSYTPFTSEPSTNIQTGGFASLSSEYRGFSALTSQNSGTFGSNSSTSQFNFAPPLKPRQVNKLD